ncbi:putative ribonuclease H-like domain-containing protein [Tanacetum coccineum]
MMDVVSGLELLHVDFWYISGDLKCFKEGSEFESIQYHLKNLKEKAKPAREQSGPPAPKTAKQLTAKRNQERVKSILLLAIPDEYLLKFHNNLAFLSSENTSSTNEVSPVSGDFRVSTVGGTSSSSQVLSTPCADEIDQDDLEELDIRWQVVMLTVRSKVECYNYHRTWHFARECKSGRNQGKRSYGDNVNYALMAISSSNSLSSSDNEVQNCSKQCLESFKTLQKNYDSEREKHNRVRLEIQGYKLALESLESRILGHEKNELAWGEKYEFQNYEIKCREVKINNLKIEIEKVVKERDELKVKIEKWEESSKSLNLLLNSQMSAKDKNGLGYGTQLNEMSNKSKINSEISMSVFEVRSSDEEITPTNDRFSKADRKKIIELKTTELKNDTTKSKTSETVGKTNEVRVEKPKSVDESVVSKPKINIDKVIIKDWNSDDEDDMSEVKTVSPVKTNKTQTVKTHVDKIGQISQKEGIGVLTRTSLVNPVRQNGKRAVHSVSTASPVSTARLFVPKIAQIGSAIRPIYPRMDNVRPRASYSPIKRSYYTRPTFRPKNLKQDVKTSGVKNMTTAGTRAVVNTGKGKMDNALKKSRWVWRPKGNYMDHESKEKGSFIQGNPEICLQDHAVVDSGCSSHMTGNKAYLSDYEDYNGGFVAFGSDPKGGKITGKGKIRTANLDFDDVYFVDELKFNLFSVSQMCDKKNSVLFTDTECLILSPSFKLLDENQVVLRAPRQNGVYSLDLKNIVPSGGITCLYANATTDESKLWHRRLGHVNFKNINKLVKGHLVRGLPSKVFVNDHTCVACKKGKQHKASCKAKLERTIRKPLELLHMDLFGPVSVESINKKKYCLVVTDDFSRFRIKREFSVARTPQQNGVAERKNRTLIEAARTMLADSLLPIPFWAEAVNTACYVLNRVLVTKPQNKTPYELLIGKPPSISFMRPVGCPLTILNTLDPLGKFDGKSDEGYLLGYSTTRIGPDLMFDLDFLTKKMNYIPVSVENQVNVDAGTQDYYAAGSSGRDKEPTQEYILLPLYPHRTRILVEDVDLEDVAEKEEQHTLTKAEQALKDDLERMVAQEIAAKALDDDTSATNTPYASAASTSIGANAGGSSFVYLGGQIPIDASTLPNADLPINPNMHDLEDDSDLISNDGIFSGAYDDEDVGVKADFNNMDNTIDVSPIPTLRVHKDHPKEDESWVEAMQEKLLQFKLQKVWILVDLPYGKKAIGTKRVFRNKRDERSIVVKNKSRLVAQGFIHEEGIDYDEVFPPVARIEAIRLFLAFASFMGFSVYQMDVKSAFLYGTIREEVYVHQPLGFVDPVHPNKVYKVKQQPDGIFISQDKYVADILKKFDFCSIRTATTPIESNKPLVKDEDGVDDF